MLSIKSLLAQAKDDLKNTSDSASLDAEVLLCFVLNKPRSYLRAWCDKVLSNDEQQGFFELVAQRQYGIPIAYLVGKKEFWSREFFITPDVLIPRPETELLIELSLERINQQSCRVLDLGTGSGIIAITLAAECPYIQVTAVDKSLAALDVAKHNAKHHQVHNIQFYQSDWFSELPLQHFDLIVSNPPYIAEQDCHLQQGDVRFEPDSALIAENNGLSDIQRIAAQAQQYLASSGHLLIEHGYQQMPAVQAIFHAEHYVNVLTYSDLSGHPRVTYGQRP